VNGRRTPIIEGLSDTDLAWLAGLLEGEGCFSMTVRTRYKTPYTQIVVALTMTDRDVLDRFVSIIGGHENVREFKDDRPNNSQAWCVHVTGYRAADLMRLVRPLMHARRAARIDQVLETWGK
jgi:hypothetical protein